MNATLGTETTRRAITPPRTWPIRLLLALFLVAASSTAHAKAPVAPVASHPQGYLGVDIRDVAEERITLLHLKDQHGAEILHVDHDGPAGKAGLRTGDVILQINDSAIESAESLRRMLRETAPGRTVTILLSRDGQSLTIVTALANREVVERQAWEQHLTVPEPAPYATSDAQITTASTQTTLPNTPTRTPAAKSFMAQMLSPGKGKATSGNMLIGPSYTGATLEMLGPQLAEFFGLLKTAQGDPTALRPDAPAPTPAFSTGLPNNTGAVGGLLVRSIEPGTPAATAGLRAGDIVMRANQTAMMTGADWLHVIHEARGKAIALLVMRDKANVTLTLIPDSKHRSALTPAPLNNTPDGTPDTTFDKTTLAILACGEILPLARMQ